jgi:hypothetical protein
MDPRVEMAKQDALTYGIPDEAYQAYRSQVHSCRRRGIEMQFNLKAWWDWWQIDGRWERRGRRGNGLVMARRGDVGPYSPENVYCATNDQNTADVDPERRRSAIRSGWDAKLQRGERAWLHGKRGDAHPKSRPVITPKGRFGSLALAAEAFGFTRQNAYEKVKNQQAGWRYE